jgi:hypothetical protein
MTKDTLPPHYVLSPNLRQQIDKIKAQAEVANSIPRIRPTNPISLIDKYTHQITEWLESLSPLQKHRKYTLLEIIALSGIVGYYHPRASNQYTGAALRKAGFKSKRVWPAEGPSTRYWYLTMKESK